MSESSQIDYSIPNCAKAEHSVAIGYKKTELGFIPDDWVIKPLVDLVNVIDGDRGHNYPSDSDFHSDGYCVFLSASNVTKNGFAFKDATFITRQKDELLRKGKLKRLDIVLTTRGSVGNFAFYDDNIPYENLRINSGMVLIRKSSEDIHSIYLYNVLKSHVIGSQIHTMSFGSAQPQLTVRDINNFVACYPSNKSEQTAIADALSDVDALIQELEKLIVKKQAIKTATMQQLLTGRTRLPAFAYEKSAHHPDGRRKGYKPSELGEIPEDWDVVSFAKLTRNIIDYRGRTPKKLGLDWGGGDIVALSAGNVKKGYIDFDEDCYFGSEDLYKKWMKNGDVEQNDIVFTMEAPLGNVALIPDSKRYILSQRTVLLQLHKEHYEPIFVYQLMMSNQFQSLLSDSATGSTAQGIKRSRFEQLLLCLPSDIKEQTAIATILSDMDGEIQSLDQRLSKTRQIKQGMMQELLTGKTRLVNA